MLEIRHVNKRYGSRDALRDVSFTVDDGRMTGFVGRNGAGKTTAMRIILGVLSADSGEVLLDGQPLSVDDRRRFGYMPEERGLYPKMKVAEQLVYLARLHGVAAPRAKANADALLERLELTARANDLVEALSLGNQQRAQIAAALVHDPEFLVLDEPFSGLDPVAVDVVQGVLSGYATAGAPVLFSSHQLDIVERLCDDLVIIAEGEIRAAGPRETLRDRFGGIRYEIHTPGDHRFLTTIPGITLISSADSTSVFEAATDAASQEALRAAVARGPVLAFGRQQPSLATIFREVIK